MSIILQIWRNSSPSLVSSCPHHEDSPSIHSCLLLACVLSSVTGERHVFCTTSLRGWTLIEMHGWIYGWPGSISTYFTIIDQGTQNRFCSSPDKKPTTPFHKSGEKAKATGKLMYSGNRACQDEMITNSKLKSK